MEIEKRRSTSYQIFKNRFLIVVCVVLAVLLLESKVQIFASSKPAIKRWLKIKETKVNLNKKYLSSATSTNMTTTVNKQAATTKSETKTNERPSTTLSTVIKKQTTVLTNKSITQRTVPETTVTKQANTTSITTKYKTDTKESPSTALSTVTKKKTTTVIPNKPITPTTVPVIKRPANLAFHWDDQLHLYRLNGKPVIWTFWDTLPVPAHIRLSMATVKCHNPDVHFEIVHQHQLSELFGYVHPAFQYLVGAHKGDYFRGTVLNMYGGIWIDADTIAFGSLRQKFEKLRTYDVLGYDNPYSIFSIAVIGPIRARTVFSQNWIKTLHAKLDKKLPILEKRAKDPSVPYPIKWGEILGDITNDIFPKLVNNGTIRYSMESSADTISQVAYWNILGDKSEKKTIKHTEFVFYFNTPINSAEMRAYTTRNLLTKRFHLTSILKASLARCRKGQKLGLNDTITIDTEENNEPELIDWVENFLVKNKLS